METKEERNLGFPHQRGKEFGFPGKPKTQSKHGLSRKHLRMSLRISGIYLKPKYSHTHQHIHSTKNKNKNYEMRRHRRYVDSELDEEARTTMKCVSCREEYKAVDAGTCRECYEEASETKEELKREIEDLKAKVSFLRFWSPTDHSHHLLHHRSTVPCFSDVVLVASEDESGNPVVNPVPVPAHKAVLASRSPVFRAMLENEMEESLSGMIRIGDVSYDVLRAFINYLYTAEASLDKQMACDLLVLAEKYQVKNLKTYCEKFMISKLNWENSLLTFTFAHQHNANSLLDAAQSLIMDNMDKLSKREEYRELVEKDPRLVVEIYESYLSKQVNTAALKDSTSKL